MSSVLHWSAAGAAMKLREVALGVALERLPAAPVPGEVAGEGATAEVLRCSASSTVFRGSVSNTLY